jgi:aubergine
VVILHGKYADVGPMIDTLTKTARNLKVELTVQKMEGPMFKDTDAIKLIDRALAQYEKCNLLMVTIPMGLKTSYPKLKQATLAITEKREILTQFVVENTLKKKGVQSIHTKLLLQMIAKRGNILWIPSYQEEMNKVMEKVMLLGIDTGSKGSCNLMAAVGTINSTFSLYSSATTKNGEGDRKFNAMLEVTLKCIEGYVSRNKSPPSEMIIFFNASPGDQINLYQENYCKKLQENVQKTYNHAIRLTVAMVNLRNSERFFTAENVPRNVPPGTLVSSTIVSKNYDFFIVSQQSNKGSIVPNHYKIITAESKLEEGHLQELIFSQCFNYVNWTGSIKVPAILQYAKKCARFNAEVMNGMEVSHGLQARPYFV